MGLFKKASIVITSLILLPVFLFVGSQLIGRFIGEPRAKLGLEKAMNGATAKVHILTFLKTIDWRTLVFVCDPSGSHFGWIERTIPKGQLEYKYYEYWAVTADGSDFKAKSESFLDQTYKQISHLRPDCRFRRVWLSNVGYFAPSGSFLVELDSKEEILKIIGPPSLSWK